MTPQNAAEFRQAMRDGPRLLVTVETFEVARPFTVVSATLKKQAAACLNKQVVWSASGSKFISRSGTETYKPTFVARATKAELHLQRKDKGGGNITLGEPPDGHYRIVLDATRIDPRRTKIDIYSQTRDDRPILAALQGWVHGDNMGCPDLTKIP